MSNVKVDRIETLDWLRGFMALSIMFYHLSLWLISPQDSSSILGRLGIYGVSIFFILSGLSMAIVYEQYIVDLKSSINFLIRRIFRIWPLLWIVCILILILQFTSISNINWIKVALNLTTLFGFIQPDNYIATGSWSIGNEMVYYLLTPLIIYTYNKDKLFGNAIFIISLIIGLFFSFYFLDPSVKLANQWSIYVNPLNNLFLYIMGMAIHYNLTEFKFNRIINAGLLLFTGCLFCILPVYGDQIVLVTGLGRLVFVSCSFMVVLCFYKLQINLPQKITKSLGRLGVATYGIYLIHPVVYHYYIFVARKAPVNYPIFLFIIVSLLTIIISFYSYKIIELRWIKIGKRLTIN